MKPVSDGCRCQLKQITISWKKMLQPIKGAFWKKIGLKLQNPKSKFQNPKFNIL